MCILRRFFAIVLALSLLPLPVHAQVQEKYIALSFDDGPSGRFTRRLLDGLDARDVKATFFLCGYRIKDYPSEAARIFESGHEIGYHGYSHRSMKELSRRDIAAEIDATRALLPATCRPTLLRPPGGCCCDAVVQVAQAKSLAIVSWSLDPMDWACSSADVIAERVLKNARDGDIVLLHDMSDSSVDAALTIVDALSARGFTFVTISELARRRESTLTAGESYYRFPPSAPAGVDKPRTSG